MTRRIPTGSLTLFGEPEKLPSRAPALGPWTRPAAMVGADDVICPEHAQYLAIDGTNQLRFIVELVRTASRLDEFRDDVAGTIRAHRPLCEFLFASDVDLAYRRAGRAA